MNLNGKEKTNNQSESSDNYYYLTKQSHWEKYKLYYLVFGTFFFTTLIVLISNHGTNNQIRKINERLNSPAKLFKSWMGEEWNDENFNERFLPKNNRPNHEHNYESGDFISPSDDQKNENWLEEIVFQESVREEFQIWVNSVKYLPRYKIGGQAEPERHALFYGPPGSGKTYLAEMFAKNESLRYIFAKFGTETFSGSSQQKVNKVMKQARNLLEKNGGSKPVVIIIDEMDSVGIKNPLMSGGSTQEVNAVLTMIDEIKHDNLNIIVIGITNYPEMLDPALKRAGRLGRQIKVPYLTKEEITKMVNYLEKDMKKEQVGSPKSEENKSKWEKEKEKESFVEWSSDFWPRVHEIIQASFEKYQQNKVGISYTDLEISIKDALAKQVSKSSKKVIPQASDFEKELKKKVDDKIRDSSARDEKKPYKPRPAPEKEKDND